MTVVVAVLLAILMVGGLLLCLNTADNFFGKPDFIRRTEREERREERREAWNEYGAVTTLLIAYGVVLLGFLWLAK